MKKQKVKNKMITAAELDNKFDNGEDVSEHFDFEAGEKMDGAKEKKKKVKSPSDLKRIPVEFPPEVLQRLDVQADKRGVTRASLVKVWIYDRLAEEQKAS